MPLSACAEQLRQHRVRDPDAAVRDGLADRPRRVGPVDGDRPALRPAGEDVRERRDADRSRAERAALVRRDQPLVDVEAARSASASPARRSRPSSSGPSAVLVERDPLLRQVDDDPRRDLLDGHLPGRHPRGHAVRPLRDLHEVRRRLAAGIDAGAADREDRRDAVDVQLAEAGEGRAPGAAVDRGPRADDRRVRQLRRAEPLERAGGAGLAPWPRGSTGRRPASPRLRRIPPEGRGRARGWQPPSRTLTGGYPP